MAPATKPSPLPDGLSPLETALIDSIRGGHRDMIHEFRAFRWSMLGLVAFLVVVVAMLKGVDPSVAAKTTQQVLATPIPAVAPADAPPTVPTGP